MAKSLKVGASDELVVVSSSFAVIDGVEGNNYVYSDGSTKFIPL